MTTPEMINPDHYKNETSLECIDAMMIAFDDNLVADFCIGNAWKYIWRWKFKGGQTDLHKATWYINRARNILGELTGVEYYGDIQRMEQILGSMEDYINRYKIGEIGNE